MDLLLATRSDGKIREIRRILSAVPRLRVVDLADAGIEYKPAEEELEPYDTFEANAASKALYFMNRSSMATVADDSGLEVDALGGAPGVRTKRFAPQRGLDGQALDDANNAHLVGRLRDVEPLKRTARYVCVAAFVEPGREPLHFRGEADGLVIESPRGSGGFGYDPFILAADVGKTFAEMRESEKDARSHRGQAFRALAAFLASRAGGG